MENNFFSEKENLESIIKNIFKDVLSCNKITTGWTNIVLDIQTKTKNYIAKFPRDNFWLKHIIKDSKIASFVCNNIFKNTKYTSPNSKIYYNNNRPFMIYEKIKGYSLTERFSYLSNQKLINISKDLAFIFNLFHTYDFSKIPNDLHYKYTDFILSMVKFRETNNNSKYNMSYFQEMLDDRKKEKQVFCHNDLNIGNVILDENDNVKSIIDYSFSGLSDIYTDLSIIACRSNDFFYNSLLNEYEKISKIKLNRDKIQNRILLRKHIEDVYIDYMKKQCPTIKC